MFAKMKFTLLSYCISYLFLIDQSFGLIEAPVPHQLSNNVAENVSDSSVEFENGNETLSQEITKPDNSSSTKSFLPPENGSSINITINEAIPKPTVTNGTNSKTNNTFETSTTYKELPTNQSVPTKPTPNISKKIVPIATNSTKIDPVSNKTVPFSSTVAPTKNTSPLSTTEILHQDQIVSDLPSQETIKDVNQNLLDENNKDEYALPSDVDQSNLLSPKIEEEKSIKSVKPPKFLEQEDSHFFAYFVTGIIVFVLGYLIVHNKQKILAIIVEGRTNKRRRASHSYKKLTNEKTLPLF